MHETLDNFEADDIKLTAHLGRISVMQRFRDGYVSNETILNEYQRAFVAKCLTHIALAGSSIIINGVNVFPITIVKSQVRISGSGNSRLDKIRADLQQAGLRGGPYRQQTASVTGEIYIPVDIDNLILEASGFDTTKKDFHKDLKEELEAHITTTTIGLIGHPIAVQPPDNRRLV
jgi:hypothetical protein